jgi:hypothetical protein
MRKLEGFTAEIPQELHATEDRLTRYGQWARDHFVYRRCGSAEGAYRPPSNAADDPRRQARPATSRIDEIMQVHRALGALPDKERIVLHILYVPRRQPVAALLRMAGIPARLCRERHAAGLRMLDNRLRLLHSRL